MNIVMAIFAKHNTTEKVLLPVPQEMIGEVMTKLNDKFGGSWVYADRLSGHGEMIQFDDGMKYQGFSSKIDRYSTAIETLH